MIQVTNDVLKGLKKELDYKWKVQTANKGGASCVAYIDARAVFDLLDDVVGADNWKTEFFELKTQMFCSLSIKVTHNDGITEWVSKTDTGIESQTEGEKGQVSDAVKRAAVQWGIGRFLYDLEIQKVKTVEQNGKFKPTDDKGNILWSGDDLTDFINKRIESKKSPVKTVSDPNKVGSYTKTTYSEGTIKKVKELSRDGKTGKEVIEYYIPEYNKFKNTNYTTILSFKTDSEIEDIIKFIENTPPKSMN